MFHHRASFYTVKAAPLSRANSSVAEMSDPMTIEDNTTLVEPADC